MSLLQSTLDGRIALKGLLGSGGMGEVHRAWDAALERPVAVKFVRGGDPREADRLLLEARLQARVEHPHVVRVHDTGTLEGRPCIVLQLVEGRTFADLASGPDWRVKVALAAQAARGLGAAHRTGLVHRDVKPANLLVEDTEAGPMARLSDFGLARDEEGGLTRSGLLMGTVDFMAPEQILGGAPVDFRADVYGLGATLYAVLAGRPPFRETAPPTGRQGPLGADPTPEGADSAPADLLRRALEAEPRPLEALVPGLPPDLPVVVAQAMEKEPARRYATADAFADDLDRVLRGEPVQARRMGTGERTLRWIRRNPVASRALGVGLLAVVSALGFAAWNSRRSALAALEAAQLGGEAKALELRLRMAHLAPAHDLRPVIAEIERALLRMDGLRGPGAAAAAYARGRVRLLLDRLEGAQRDLETAQRLGFRGREIHEALGLVYGRLYQQELLTAEALSDPAARTRRMDELGRRLRDPALAHLGAAGDDPLIQAYRVLLKREYEAARRWALKSREQDPERFEGTLLAAQVWEREGNEAFNRRDHARALACAQSGSRLIEGLARDLRSDPAVPFLAGRLKDLEAVVRARAGEDVRGLVREGMSLVDQSLALNPDQPSAWLARASLLGTLIVMENQQIEATAVAHGEEMVAACRRAVALAPEWGEAHMRLAWAHQNLGNNRNQQGLDPGTHYQDGYRAALDAARLQPWNASCLHMALSNLIGEVATKLDEGRHPGEALGLALDMCQKWAAFPGVVQDTVQTTRIELQVYLARSLWFEGRDPEPVLAQAMADQLALLGAEPDQVGHLNVLTVIAFEWLRVRALQGKPGEDILQEILPKVEAGLRRHPDVVLLKVCRAQLLWSRLFARGPGVALVAAQVEAATRAVADLRAVLQHPAATEFRGWTLLAQAEAEAGAGQLEARALADFRVASRGLPAYRSPRLGMVRALRLAGGGRQLAEAESVLQGLAVDGPHPDPETLLLRALVLESQGQAEEAGRWRARALAGQPRIAGHPLLRRPTPQPGR